MDAERERAIRAIVDVAIKSFAEGFESRHVSEVDDPEGTLNMKKNNCFIRVLGADFMFYSSFVRSFDSSFGHVLEDMGKAIAKFTYETHKTIESYILPEQVSHISKLVDDYEDHRIKIETSQYEKFYYITPANTDSFKAKHDCDNWFFDRANKTHYLIELKAGGDLDKDKAKSQKLSAMKQYFLLKNKVPADHKIYIKFATAYNKYGEGNPWHQSNVDNFFAKEELLIGRDYWNFVCNDPDGFNIVMDQYKESAEHIRGSIFNIMRAYNIA